MGYVATKSRPRYLDTDLKAEFAGDNPDYFDIKTNKWYSTSSGSELVTNGTFDIGTTGWTDNGLANLSWVSGKIRVTNNSTGYGQARQAISTTIGKKYKIIGYGSPVTATVAVIQVGTTAGGIEYGAYATQANFEFVAQTTITHVTLQANNNGAGTYCEFDNISVFQSDLTIGSEITPRNYLNNVVYADHNGQPEYVEEVAKVEYKDSMKLNKLSVIEGFDLGQTWQDVTSKRVAGTTYTNSTGKPITVSFTNPTTTTHYTLDLYVDGLVIANVNNYRDVAGRTSFVSAIVPNGSTYKVTTANVTSFIWMELR